MAPPTGTHTYTIFLWEQDGVFCACVHDSLFSLRLYDQDEDEAFSRAKQATLRELRSWLEVHEPYYVEDLLSGYIKFERKRLETPCPICCSRSQSIAYLAPLSR